MPDEFEFSQLRASWLELFYDLAYVAAIAQLTYLLIEANGHLLDFLQFTFIFVIVFLSWLSSMVYRNLRAGEESTTDRVATIIHMIFALTMSVFIQHAFDTGAIGFILGYVGTRLTFIYLLSKNYRQYPERAPQSKNTLWGFRIAAIVLLASVFVPQPWQGMVWLFTIIFELLVPYTNGIVSRNVQNPRRLLNKYHFPERLGLFTILVMGESVIVVAVVNNIATSIISFEAGLIALASFLIIAGLWWIYFDHIERFAIGKPMRLFAYMYAHIPILIGIMLIAVGAKAAMLGKFQVVDPIQTVTMGIVLAIIGFNVLKFATYQKTRRVYLPSIVFVVLVGSGTLLEALPVAATMFVLAAAYGLYAYFENKECATCANLPLTSEIKTT